MTATKSELETRLGKLYTELTGKPWKNTSKQIEEFSKYMGTPQYQEGRKLIIQILSSK